MAHFKDIQAFLQAAENSRARALMRAMDYAKDDLCRARIGVVNSWGETSPGHIHLRSVADAVKAGIWQPGGTPFEFRDFATCPMAVGEHGMRYDTPTRDIIAAEVEASTWSHMFDGLVMISSCDKNVPGHLLAAARLDIPVIIVARGPVLSLVEDGDVVEIGIPHRKLDVRLTSEALEARMAERRPSTSSH